MKTTMYNSLLSRLEEIREYEWNDNTMMVHGEYDQQKGVRQGEKVLEAIARHMAEVAEEFIAEERKTTQAAYQQAYEMISDLRNRILDLAEEPLVMFPDDLVKFNPAVDGSPPVGISGSYGIIRLAPEVDSPQK